MAVRKTGAFFTTCFQASVLAARAGEQRLHDAATYGALLGLLFQAQDDYLDLVGEKGRRARCSDLVEGKISLPVAWVCEHADARERAALLALIALPRAQKTPEKIDEAFNLLERTGALRATADRLGALLEEALAHPLSATFPDLATRLLTPVRHALPQRATGGYARVGAAH